MKNFLFSLADNNISVEVSVSARYTGYKRQKIPPGSYIDVVSIIGRYLMLFNNLVVKLFEICFNAYAAADSQAAEVIEKYASAITRMPR